MTLRINTRLGLICLMILLALSACGPGAPAVTPTTTAEPTLPATETPPPSPTPFPTDTPTLSLTVEQTGTAGATALPGATQPAGDATAAPPAQGTTAAQPTTAANPPAGGATTTQDVYQYLGQDIPDNTQFSPNRTVTITWTVQNVGTTTWTTDYTLRHFSGPAPAQSVYNFTREVPPDGTLNLVVTFTTPAEPGDYNMWFKLTNTQQQNFGDVNLVYTVTNNPTAATSTPAN